MNSQDYSRIINQKNLDRLNGLILKEKLVIGGHGDKENRFFPPTLMKDVSWSDKVMEDEIFGPILPVIPYVDLHETLEKLNSLSKPLAFYLFTGSDKMKDQILSRVSFGGGCVNDTIVHLSNPGLPFGGVGASGMGSYHGQKSFETFTHFKSIFEQSSKVDIPLRYPPYGKKLKWIKYLLG
jgi:aldehyde dehydrogenase (NAD+)